MLHHPGGKQDKKWKAELSCATLGHVFYRNQYNRYWYQYLDWYWYRYYHTTFTDNDTHTDTNTRSNTYTTDTYTDTDTSTYTNANTNTNTDTDIDTNTDTDIASNTDTDIDTPSTFAKYWSRIGQKIIGAHCTLPSCFVQVEMCNLQRLGKGLKIK